MAAQPFTLNATSPSQSVHLSSAAAAEADLHVPCLVEEISVQVKSALSSKLGLHLSHLALSAAQVKQLVGVQATSQAAAVAL